MSQWSYLISLKFSNTNIAWISELKYLTSNIINIIGLAEPKLNSNDLNTSVRFKWFYGLIHNLFLPGYSEVNTKNRNK